VAGWPAITRRTTGGSDAAATDAAGSAWYVATQPGGELLGELLERALGEARVSGVLDQGADGVEAVRRGDTTFVINHRPEPREVVLGGVTTTIPPRDALILRA
jgi:beta-galactosidase